MVRNFNNKLSKLVKKNPENKNILPQFYNEDSGEFESRITIEGLKEAIQTRQDYNRQINMLKRFSRKGAEEIIEAPGNQYGSRTTKWQKEETSRLVGIVNRKRKERLNRLSAVEMANAEGELGYTLGDMFGMGLASKNKLSPSRGFTPSQSQTDIKYKLRALIEESRTKHYKDKDEILKENYIKALSENYNSNDIKPIIASIKKMDIDLFLVKFEARGDKFEMAYPPEQDTEEYKNYLSELEAYWMKN